MSLYKKAGLVQIPSGYKAADAKLYSVVPNNGDGDFDFTRASTATRVNKDGLIETVAINQARLDYPLLDGVVQDNPVLLLEPQRANDIQRSEEFDNAYWTKYDTSVTANQATSPNGSVTADQIIEDTGTSTHQVGRLFSFSSGSTYSVSVFVKYNGRNIQIGAGNTGTWAGSVKFDLENGVVLSEANGTGKIENFGNGWYRCIVIGTASATASTNINFGLLNNQTLSYTGDGTSGLYIWGAQVEAGSYPTSYIPTSGSSVTRSADICNGAGTANDFNDSEGVLYANIAFTKEPVSGFVTISDGTDDERITIYRVGSLFPNKIQGQIREGNTARVSFGFDTNFIDLYNKIAIKYKANDFAFWVNGFEIDSNTSNTLIPDNLNNLEFAEGDGGNPFNGKSKELMTFKEALSDIELETLTSYKSFNEMATEQLYTIQ